jgi:ketosteroid isomerase-like protein
LVRARWSLPAACFGESETDGKPASVRIGALQVWQKQDGSWKLLARQGYKSA